jgi:hypothetical protein
VVNAETFAKVQRQTPVAAILVTRGDTTFENVKATAVWVDHW